MISDLRKENYPLGQTVQTISKEIGGVLSYNIFVYLNSVKLSKKIFNHDGPILTVPQFFFILGLILLIIYFFLIFGVNEKQKKHKSTKLVSQFKNLSYFFLNPNMLTIIIFLLTWRIGFNSVSGLYMVEIQRSGIDIETISTLMFILTPFTIGLYFVFGKFTKPGREMEEVVQGLYWKFFSTGAALLSLYLVINVLTNTNAKILAIVISEIISDIVEARIYISLGAFFIRIADKNMGGTFLTTLYAVQSFSILFLESAILFLSDYLNIYEMTFGGWCFAVIYIYLIKDELIRLQSLKQGQFLLKSQY